MANRIRYTYTGDFPPHTTRRYASGESYTIGRSALHNQVDIALEDEEQFLADYRKQVARAQESIDQQQEPERSFQIGDEERSIRGDDTTWLESLDISDTAKESLIAAGLTTPERVAETSDEDLFKLRYIGQTTIDVLRGAGSAADDVPVENQSEGQEQQDDDRQRKLTVDPEQERVEDEPKRRTGRPRKTDSE